MIKKRSQAALEFLMTYGWAILVVLVAIGALAYFGVLSPDKFLPAKCTLQAGIACLDHKVQAAPTGINAGGLVTVVVQNSMGFDFTGVVARAGDCGSSSSTTLANGEKKTFTIDCLANSILAGTTKYNKQINLTYTVSDTGISHTNQGQLTARVE